MSNVHVLTATQSILVRVELSEDSGVPLTEIADNLDDVLEVLDFALFLSHGDAFRWENEGGRGQVRLSRMRYGSPVVMDIQLVMSGGLGLTYGAVLAGVSAVAAVLLTASKILKNTSDATVRFAEADKTRAEAEEIRARIKRETDEDAGRRVLEAMESVAFSGQDVDVARRIQAQVQGTTTFKGIASKRRRFVRAAGRLTRREDIEFRVEH